MSESFDQVLQRSRSTDHAVRWAAAQKFAVFSLEPRVIERLGELLDDDVIEVEVAATETLMRHFGKVGLELALGELVRRDGDGDLDYLAMKLHEVVATQHDGLFEDAMAIAIDSGSERMRTIVDELIIGFNRMQTVSYNKINPDGTRKPERPWRM